MGRPIVTDYEQSRRILTGVNDPSGLGLVFELDGSAKHHHAISV